MFKNMKIGTKIAAGFGVLIAIVLALGTMAAVKMKVAAGESTKLAKEYVPEVEVAGLIRGASNRVMYNMRGYGYSGKESYFKAAQEEMAAMNSAIARGRRLEEEAAHLKKLSSQLDTIEKAHQEYKTAMNETRETMAHIIGLRQSLDENAGRYIETSNAFLSGQNKAFKRDLAERQQKIIHVTRLVELGAEARVLYFKAQATKDPVLLKKAIRVLDDVDNEVELLRAITRDTADIRLIEDIVRVAGNYQTAMAEFGNEFRKGADAQTDIMAAARQKMDANAKIYVHDCDAFLESQQAKLNKDMTERHAKITLANDVIDLGNDIRIKTFKSQALRNPALIIEAKGNFKQIDEKLVALRKITRLQVDLSRIDTVQAAARGYGDAMDNFLEDWKKLQQLDQTRDKLGKEMISACKVMAEAGMQTTFKIAGSSMSSLNTRSTIMTIGLIIALVVGGAMAFFITRSITRSISAVASGLDEGAELVSSASRQVSTSSQTLAEGASEQAASIEETSASLEQMSSMTRQNADNANQADNLMKEANQVVTSANASMGDLIQSMEEISKASEETSKIIKTIDEIAFQTNLLALNAAVEAARAGEAGAGFAVVADEVRNLAMRAADAAKNTATLIEGTVKQVNEGSQLVARTNEAFAEVAGSTSKVGELVGEIAAASNEQAQGISQINTAVNEVDKVTQQNAASAEESAAASEQMNGQSQQMRRFVAELVRMVGGTAVRPEDAITPPSTVPAAGTSNITHLNHTPLQEKGAPALAVQTDPDKLIPLDDDFMSF